MLSRSTRFLYLVLSALFVLFVLSGPGLAEKALTMEELSRFKTLDDSFADVARIEPRFAGLHVRGDTLVYRLVTDGAPITEEMQKSVVAAVQKVFGDTLERFNGAPRDFEKANFAMSDLVQWHRAMTGLQSLDGFSFSDLDERRSMLVLGLTEGADVAKAEDGIKELGIPLEAVEFQTHPLARRLSRIDDNVRPLVGGLQIKPRSLSHCTAWLFVSLLDNDSHTRGMITNSHCAGYNSQGTVTGRIFKQPGPGVLGANRVGEEIADPPYNITHSQCGAGRMCRRSDSLVSSVEPDVDMSRGLIARIGSWGGFTISGNDPDYQVSWIAWFPLMGERVTKVGRTTGKTGGEVLRTCSPQAVGDANGDDTGITMVCQYSAVAAPSIGGGVAPIFGVGDSGAPVFALPRNPVTPNDIHAVYLYGILWGSTSMTGDSFMFSSTLWTLVELTPAVGPIRVLH